MPVMTPPSPVSHASADAATSRVLAALAGPDATPKPDQLAAVRAVAADRRRTLVVQATGWGKSLVYLAAAAAVREAGAGPVLVVSPLLALMRDQVAAASRAGLVAVSLNSANFEDWEVTEAALLADEVDVLFVSPERLANPRFGDRILSVLLDRLGALVVDEAHCISDWGFDFRPDYQRLARVMAARPDLPVLATTATANTRVTEDVAAQLGHDTVVLRGPLARASLTLSVVPGLGPLQRYGWVAEALRTLPGSGIVYALTVAEATRLAAFLSGELAGEGLVVAAYTGQMETAAREQVEEDLRANRLKAVVATSALGMGYDKPDLAFCVHVGSPSSPVAYYQQVGRAGRALPDAVAVLLPAETDARIWEYFATANTPQESLVRRILDALAEAGEPVSVPALEVSTGIRRSRVEGLLKVLAVDGATARVGSGWTATGAPWRYDAARYAGLTAARRAEADLMRHYAAADGCLMGFLRQALDDVTLADDPGACGRCSVCTGQLPAQLPAAPSASSVAAARAFCRGIDVPLEPRKMWPAGMAGRRGRIAGDLIAAEGRALAFADDPGWSELVAPLVADTASTAGTAGTAGTVGTPVGSAGDGAVPDAVVDALVGVLARWRGQWEDRPVAVVPVPSRTRPKLVSSIAAALAQVGRMPVADVLEAVGPRPASGVASGARAAAVAASLRVRPGVQVPSGPILLVDDVSASGWTLTVAAAALREAGAGQVLPLVLHKRPA
jgi:ATP-dependent DNA helicase RecQ